MLRLQRLHKYHRSRYMDDRFEVIQRLQADRGRLQRKRTEYHDARYHKRPKS